MARWFGFELIVKFNHPYIAHSPTDFWRRWHISLSTWFRDFVYIPLGGNRVPALQREANLMATFLVSGLWHGANWNYVLWGLYHGTLVVVTRNIGSLLKFARAMARSAGSRANRWHVRLHASRLGVLP